MSRILIAVHILNLCGLTAVAQVTQVIEQPGTSGFSTVPSNTRLNVWEGRTFPANPTTGYVGAADGSITDAELSLLGGSLFDTQVLEGGVVNIHSGHFDYLTAGEGGVINVFGGDSPGFGAHFPLRALGGEVRIDTTEPISSSVIAANGGHFILDETAGRVSLEVGSGGSAQLNGGTYTLFSPGGSTTITGGRLASSPSLLGGSLTIVGSNLRLNGVLLDTNMEPGDARFIPERNRLIGECPDHDPFCPAPFLVPSVLEATLTDGTPFFLSLDENVPTSVGIVAVYAPQVPEPSTLFSLVSVAAVLGTRRSPWLQAGT